MWPTTYQRDVEAAWTRIRANPSHILQTQWGDVEFCTQGSGQPVLMGHGIFGSHVEALAMTVTYYGEHALALAPSRFGYFGSSLPTHATPALQVDVYAALLDHLGIDRAVAIGFSAGGPSMIELALRHPDRVELLVLLSSALPRKPIPRLVTELGPPLMKLALTDRVMWTYKTLFPGAFQNLIGVPRSFEPSASEVATIREIGASMLPVKPRRDGVVFDAFTGNSYVNSSALEEISVPALLVHAMDDGLAPYRTAVNAVARIPSVTFVSLQGGHEFLGHEHEVRTAISTALAQAHLARDSSDKTVPSGAVA